MREELERLVAIGKLERRHVDPLLALQEAGYCLHRAWGCGRVTGLDPVLGRLTIDFANKPGHGMDLGFAAESLRSVPANHILVRKLNDTGVLKTMAVTDPQGLMRIVLESFDGRATVDQIQQALVPEVISADWKKWWEGTKRVLKKDGHFQVPVKKTDPVMLLAEAVGMQDRLVAEVRAARGLKARVGAVQEILKSAEDLTDREALGTEVIPLLNVEIASHLKTMPGLALEGILARDDLRALSGVPAGEGEIGTGEVWQIEPPLLAVLAEATAGKHGRILDTFRQAHPDTWIEAILGVMNEAPAKVVGEMAELLIREGQFDKLKDKLLRLISQHAATSDLLLWVARARSDAYADILGPEVFRAMLTAIERDLFLEKKSNKLRDYVLSDHELIVELISSADIEVIKDLTRALQLSPSFDDMDKRSLLARIVKAFPSVQSLISSEHVKQEVNLLVTWGSLERRKGEYHDLVEKQIPANSRDIALARSYGDLRENHEYKAAKEAQKVLMRRKSELERDLGRARGTDFSAPRTDVVSPGSVVRVVEEGKDHHEEFILMGAWDFDESRGIISYLSPIGQSLLNRAVGDEVEIELAGVISRYRIEAIREAPPTSAVPVETIEAEAGTAPGAEPVAVESSGTGPAPDAGPGPGEPVKEQAPAAGT
ncbi:MAG: GreA/GreB family elongation factor [Verrucomicrobiae bacterium]|nr:GreA/GreB family elongation factor [Verrucomicrobiae bacterium]